MRSLFVASVVFLALYGTTKALKCQTFVEEGAEFDEVWADIESSPDAIAEWEFCDENEHLESHHEKREPKLKSKKERKDLLKHCIKGVNKINEKKDTEWCARPNYVSTLDDKEFKIALLGIDKKVPPKVNNLEATKRSPTERRRRVALPVEKRGETTVDHSAASGPVERQRCGNCWAYSGSHAVVAALKLKASKTIDGSEIALTRCVYDATQAGPFNKNGPHDGCNGGHSFHGYDFLKTNTYLAEDQYTTELEPKTCDKTKLANPQPVVTGWKFVDGQGFSTGIINTKGTDAARTAMKAVLKDQPVVVYMNVGPGEFKSYSTGVWDTDVECKVFNHGMLAVGYGKDDNGNDYWLIKNSWGESWGDKGFIKVKAGKNVCNVEAVCNYPVVKTSGGGGDGGDKTTTTTTTTTTAKPTTTATEDYYYNYY